MNVCNSLEATQLQGSTGVLVSSVHPKLIWTRTLLMIQHVVGILLHRSFLSWQYVVAAHFNEENHMCTFWSKCMKVFRMDAELRVQSCFLNLY